MTVGYQWFDSTTGVSSQTTWSARRRKLSFGEADPVVFTFVRRIDFPAPNRAVKNSEPDCKSVTFILRNYPGSS
jgi:hypothetical protein